MSGDMGLAPVCTPDAQGEESAPGLLSGIVSFGVSLQITYTTSRAGSSHSNGDNEMGHQHACVNG